LTPANTLPSSPVSGKIIDIHHHISPTPWLNALMQAKLDSPPVRRWNPEQSLSDMDAAGVGTAVVSPTQPAVSFMRNAAQALDVTRASNEYTLQFAQRHPGRVGLFCMLPLPHVDATLQAIAHALDVLHADGVAMLTSYQGRYLGHADFEPVMAELNQRKAVVYTHPNEPACCQNVLPGISGNAIEYGTDTTRTIASLIFSGVAERYPDIRFIFSHAGGTVTALTDRFTKQLITQPNFKEQGWTGARVQAQLRRFHYDTAQSANDVAMTALTRMVPTSQIVFGSDFPYRTSLEHVESLAQIFSPAQLQSIERDNALRLFGHDPGLHA
jgi:predicted TIM-barrel fold metal-dependent hydrolase